MNFRFLRRRIKDADLSVELDTASIPQHSIAGIQAETNIADGAEFLNDAIRMKEQPLMYTEDCVAPGSPEGLL